jgi:hypothetical protein
MLMGQDRDLKKLCSISSKFHLIFVIICIHKRKDTLEQLLLVVFEALDAYFLGLPARRLADKTPLRCFFP